ncbi:aldehyde dehydrogenase family protein [Roseiterribacter gracilis]|uniref:Aldehyde dehydrogenase n=1 Tax=Roseiterribacter gracilis TaxID=2812848 RepID=A0A8S8XBZ7_9PROT|nr:aldehyde dehydrogenase [Rhodospirillales bacterium TMPK1]
MEPALLLDAARSAQRDWATVPVTERLQFVRHARHALARAPVEFAGTVARAERSAADTLAMEVLPLLEAMRFLERRAARALRTRRADRSDRPLWLRGVTATIEPAPLGVVLVIAPGNYPLFIAGVQAVQALVAGNAVIVKPAPGERACLAALRGAFLLAGLPDALFQLTDDSVETASKLVAAGPDKILLTGSSATGRNVLRAAAETLTPTVMELSGNDVSIVLNGANPVRTAATISFAFALNASHTCIAPRRLFVERGVADAFIPALEERLAELAPMPVDARTRARLMPLLSAAASGGATWSVNFDTRAETSPPLLIKNAPDDAALHATDLFAPVLSLRVVDAWPEATHLANLQPHALGASVFGPRGEAAKVAAALDVGVVTINDAVVATADPRVPFGGKRQSGFGVTRGIEGLLELTYPKVTLDNRASFRPQLKRNSKRDEEKILASLVRLLHAGEHRRRSLRALLSAVVRKKKVVEPD